AYVGHARLAEQLVALVIAYRLPDQQGGDAGENDEEDAEDEQRYEHGRPSKRGTGSYNDVDASAGRIDRGCGPARGGSPWRTPPWYLRPPTSAAAPPPAPAPP